MFQDHTRWLRGFAFIAAACTAYAAARYHVAQPEPWSRFFFWTANKSISFAAVSLLAASYFSAARGGTLARPLGLAGFVLAFVHSLLSWPLLGPANYPKLYSNSALNDSGLWALAAGIGAMNLLFAPAFSSFQGARESLGARLWPVFQRLGYAALALTALHVLVIGYKGWLAPRAWPAALPPITLLSFFIAAAPLLRRLAPRTPRTPRKGSAHA